MGSFRLSASVFLLFGAMIFFASFAQRDDFGILITVYLLAFAAYYFLVKAGSTLTMPAMIALVILLRLPFLFSTPALSDDVYRFIWDGQLMAEGVNPYLSLPSEIDELTASQIDPDQLLRDKMNSSQYYSVYTPLNQLIFWGIASITGNNFTYSLIAFRLLLILADLVAVFVLMRLLVSLGRSAGEALWYGLNPLLIIEGVGNIHFEGLVFALLVIALFLSKRKGLAALFYYLSVMLKLVPLIFLPLVLKSKNWVYYLLAALAPVILILSLLPFQGDGGFWNSLGLYFGSFEFNASIYYFLRSVGFQMVGYNPIAVLAPSMALGFALFAGIFSYLRRKEEGLTALLKNASILMLVYLLITTTVHPWYLIPLLGLSILAAYRFAIYWSLLIFLSYSHYNGGGFNENYTLIVLEYLLLGIVLLLEFSPRLRKRIAGAI